MPENRQLGTSSQDRVFRYEDGLRAIGRYIDDHGLQDVVLLQRDSGIVLRGLQSTASRSGKQLVNQPSIVREMVEHVFTAADLN